MSEDEKLKKIQNDFLIDISKACQKVGEKHVEGTELGEIVYCSTHAMLQFAAAAIAKSGVKKSEVKELYRKWVTAFDELIDSEDDDEE